LKVFSNLALSVDGRIADNAAPAKMLGTPADRKMMSFLRSKADVILTGSSTLKAFPHCYKAKRKDLPARDRKNLKYAANAIISASGELDSSMAFWNDPDVIRFIFTTKKGFKKAMAAAKERAFVVECGEGPQVDLSLVLARLKKSGLQNVLVEGGGQTIAHFLRQNFLQEMHLTLTPWMIGGLGNPLLVPGLETFVPWKSLKLLSSKKIRDELFLHYQVKGAKRV